MYKRAYIFLVLFIVCIQFMQAQKSYSIKGIVKEAASGEPVPYATVVIWNTTQGTATDSVGNFEITGVAPGSYRLQASFLGYKPEVTAEFRVANKDIFYPIELEPGSENLQEVSVVASPFRKTAESPLGLRVIGFKEIEKSAGGNRDISRVVQSFPGVASTAAFRNDLMVRGGGPSENRFFLDGVEIPNINHFSTQGAPCWISNYRTGIKKRSPCAGWSEPPMSDCRLTDRWATKQPTRSPSGVHICNFCST